MAKATAESAGPVTGAAAATVESGVQMASRAAEATTEKVGGLVGSAQEVAGEAAHTVTEVAIKTADVSKKATTEVAQGAAQSFEVSLKEIVVSSSLYNPYISVALLSRLLGR
ncbi:hypothetical protein HK104_008215 [Borealophlyctis nickersoniae]|nr:hypothetical protein HK104_008215 [Borealophlyctis nickersoniae]